MFHLAACALLLLLPGIALGEVYRWTDAEGRVRYGDRPPDAARAKSIATPAGAQASASADVRVPDTAIEWFTIRGTTSEQMRATMSETAPFSEARKSRVWGQCFWWVEWEFRHEAGPAGCRIGQFSLALHSKMKLPRWADSASGGAELRARWETFEKRLRQHEDGHKANGIRAANDLARRLRALPEFPDCAALNGAIVAIRDRIVSEYRLLDDAFDRVDLLYLTGFR